jgi:hypothetical protein
MGPTGNPFAFPPSYVTAVMNYVNQNFAPVTSAQPLYTPENLYPTTGVKTLQLDQSVAEGVPLLDMAIKQQLAANPSGSVTVLGYSQSADLASLEMQNLANPTLNPSPPTATQLGFTLIGDSMAPNGGLLSRFPGFPAGTPLTVPSIHFTFYGATPPNTIYPTHIYTLEYDGIADVPQYPINILADLNALAGYEYVHGTYPMINPASLPPGYAIQTLPTSPGYTGVTTYSMITIPNLPLLDPLRAIPVVGNPLADLLQPDLRVLVNLGYGSTTQGWSTGYANVPTPFGLFPPVSAGTVLGALATGTQQGIGAFTSDLGAEAVLPAQALSVSGLQHALTTMPSVTPGSMASTGSPIDNVITALQAAITNIPNAFASAISTGYSVVLPTADFATAALITLPAYDANLFLSGIQQAIDGNVLGGLQYALVAPIAADVGLYTLFGGLEAITLVSAAQSIITDFAGLL